MDSDIEQKPWLVGVFIVGTIGVLTGLGFYVRACNIAQTATLGAAEQSADRRVYEQSKAYRDGLQRDFDELLLEYNRAKDPDSKAAVLATIRHRAEGAPADLVPPEIKSLLQRGTP